MFRKTPKLGKNYQIKIILNQRIRFNPLNTSPAPIWYTTGILQINLNLFNKGTSSLHLLSSMRICPGLNNVSSSLLASRKIYFLPKIWLPQIFPPWHFHSFKIARASPKLTEFYKFIYIFTPSHETSKLPKDRTKSHLMILKSIKRGFDINLIFFFRQSPSYPHSSS